MEFLVTHVRELDQGLYLGHGNRDSALAITIRIGISDALLITTYNVLINKALKNCQVHIPKTEKKEGFGLEQFQRPSWYHGHTVCGDCKSIILFYLGHGNVPLLSDFLYRASLQCSLKSV